MLQYRSVAFVTYVSEFHAQFAKEAMACQSLDNDEILNVRWATEDPNPVQKVAEKRRLVDMGQEAIKARMDPRIVDAMRAVRALEDGDALDEGQGEEDEAEPDAKRRRIEGDTADTGSGDDEEQENYPPLSHRQQQQPSAPPIAAGLLSADTLEGLKYFAEIRKRTAGVTTQQRAPPRPSAAGLGLAAYGSDDEED